MKNGFSLIELMITVLVLAIAIAVGAPSFTDTIQNNRLAGQTNSINGALSYVRTEAVKLNGDVSICSSSDQSTCNNTGAWEDGWVIFIDDDGNGVRAAGETILRVGEPLQGNNTLRLDGFASANAITFDNQGRITSSGTLVFCDEREEEEAVGIVINISGQTRKAVDQDDPKDSIINAHDGDDIACP